MAELGSGVGLVLGAGGVIGHAWHAGVLAALAEAGWDARRSDIVVGTSAGSVVGALLRVDLDPRDIYARVTGQPLSAAGRRIVARGIGESAPISPPSFRAPSRGGWAPASPSILLRAFNPLNLRLGLLAAGGLPRGTTDTAIISEEIARLHADGWPDRALWLCAVRLRDGRLVVFGRDATASVAEAVAASCAIPGLFAPVPIAGDDYVDGGAHSPTNADLLAGRALELVIVSSPMSLDRAAARRPRPDRALRLGHRVTLLREVAAVRRSGATVVSFQPGPTDLVAMGPRGATLGLERREPVALQARETTLRRLDTPAVREALAPVLA